MGELVSDRMLHIGVAAWIIQDGNYPDLAVGQDARFALEFSFRGSPRPSASSTLFAEHLGANRYRILGRVIFATQTVWVIDTGRFLAFDEHPQPSHAEPGAFIEGEVDLGIDPFFYFEYLHAIAGMPQLSYPWLVQVVRRETTPWLEEKDGDGRTTLKRRDERREAYEDVTSTNAWGDDGGNGYYVLGCLPLGPPGPPG